MYGKKNLPHGDYAREAEHRRLDREAKAEGIMLPPYPAVPHMSIQIYEDNGDMLPQYGSSSDEYAPPLSARSSSGPLNNELINKPPDYTRGERKGLDASKRLDEHH